MQAATRKRLIWFVGLWLAGVITVTALAGALRIILVGF